MPETVVTEGTTKTYYPERWGWSLLKLWFWHPASFIFVGILLYEVGMFAVLGPHRHPRLKSFSDDWVFYVGMAIIGAIFVQRIRRQGRRPLIALSPDSFELFRGRELWKEYSKNREVPYRYVQRLEEKGRWLCLETETEGPIAIPLDLLSGDHRRELVEDFRSRVPQAALAQSVASPG